MKAYNVMGDVRIEYRDQSDFERIARQFGIFEEWKVVVHHLFTSPISLWWDYMVTDDGLGLLVGKYQGRY